MCANVFISFSVILLLLFHKSLWATVSDEILVQLNDGKIKGISQQSEVTNSTRTFYSFLGVRYARPPVGNLRFQPPQPVEPWQGVYDATYEKNICYQAPSDSDLESEDCLFLNIFTPQGLSTAYETTAYKNTDEIKTKVRDTITKSKISDEDMFYVLNKIENPLNLTNISSLLPVMLFIHGGGFVQGYGYVSGVGGPDFFMDYGVILVSINYRLGPFGFLSTGDTVIPGNNGLKDQNFAIQWTKQNIRSFGGDPNKITIFGQSSGSASVGYQLLSSKSKGLFGGAILESGAALTPWAYQRNQTNITYATAGILNKTFNDKGYGKSTELLNFLLNSSAVDLDQASKAILTSVHFLQHQILQGFFYAPVLEVGHEDAFITERMYESLEKGNFNKVPVIMGMNAEESVVLYDSTFSSVLEILEGDPSLMVPDDMHLNKNNESVVANLIKTEYLGLDLGNENVGNRTAGAIKFFTDHCFARSIIKQAELQSTFSEVFFYLFTYHGKMGGNQVTYPGTGNVGHSEELPYMFVKNVTLPSKNVVISTSNLTAFSKEDLDVHYRFMKLWTNFAKTGNPTPQGDEVLQDVWWPEVDLKNTETINYLEIGKDLGLKENPRPNVYNFWYKLYDDFAVRPYDTY